MKKGSLGVQNINIYSKLRSLKGHFLMKRGSLGEQCIQIYIANYEV